MTQLQAEFGEIAITDVLETGSSHKWSLMRLDD